MKFTNATIIAVAALVAQGSALPHVVPAAGCSAVEPPTPSAGLPSPAGRTSATVLSGNWQSNDWQPGTWQSGSYLRSGLLPSSTQAAGHVAEDPGSKHKDTPTATTPTSENPTSGGTSSTSNQLLFGTCLSAQNSCKNEAGGDGASCDSQVGACCDNMVSECQKVANDPGCQNSDYCQKDGCDDLKKNCYAAVGLPLPSSA